MLQFYLDQECNTFQMFVLFLLFIHYGNLHFPQICLHKYGEAVVILLLSSGSIDLTCKMFIFRNIYRCKSSIFRSLCYSLWVVSVVQWLSHPPNTRKVAGSSPARNINIIRNINFIKAYYVATHGSFFLTLCLNIGYFSAD